MHEIWCNDCNVLTNRCDSELCTGCKKLFCNYCVGYLCLYYESEEQLWEFYCHECLPTCSYPDCNETPSNRCRNCELNLEWENSRYCKNHYAEKGLCALCYDDENIYDEYMSMIPFVTEEEKDSICANCCYYLETNTVCYHNTSGDECENICVYCLYISNDYHDTYVGCDKCKLNPYMLCEKGCGEFAIYTCKDCDDQSLKYCRNCHVGGKCITHYNL